MRGARFTILYSVAVLAISTAALFIKLCAMDALSIAYLRMAAGAVVYFGLARLSIRPLASLDGRNSALLLVCGVLLALHFGTWTKAFEHTSVASNLLLLVTVPVFAAVFGYVFLGERITLNTFISVSLAIGGSALVVWEDVDPSAGKDALFGDALCVIGSAALALFYTAGKEVRGKLNFVVFNYSVFAFAATLLLPVCLLLGSRFSGYSSSQWMFLGLIVLIPTCMGHALLNWAAKYARVFTVNAALPGETAFGIALAFIFLPGETIGVLKIGGGILLLASVLFALRDERHHSTLQDGE